jgi:hypothetical protein
VATGQVAVLFAFHIVVYGILAYIPPFSCRWGYHRWIGVGLGAGDPDPDYDEVQGIAQAQPAKRIKIPVRGIV